MKKYMMMFLIFNVASAAVLLTNGDFEQDLVAGWTQTIQGENYYDTLDRSVDFYPDPDYEVRVKKYDAAYAKLFQTVNIATTDLEFHASALLYAYEYNPATSYWAAAAVVLSYLDNENEVLGETRICHLSPHCPWVGSDNLHLIEIADPYNWYEYSFNINDELTNLPGVDPADIAKISVALYDTTDGC
jgi:hypothetical protein